MIPKSLHTVTVLVAVARLLRERNPDCNWNDAVYYARVSLGYADSPDLYGLCAQAVAKLNKGSK